MALSRDKSILIGVAALAGLSFLVYKQAQKDAALGSAESAAKDFPAIKGSDDLDKIELTNGSKDTVVLEKKDGKWALTKPVATVANENNVKTMLDNLKELKITELVASQPDDAVKKDYNLDPTQALHLVAYKGADKKLDEFFGKSGGRGELMMVAGNPAVFAASGYSSYLYTREVKDWRVREIFKFDDTNAVSVKLVAEKGEFSFTKGDKWAGTFKGAPIENLDESKVTEIVRGMKYMNAEDFADGKTPADAGLTPPAGSVTVSLKDNAGTYTLKLGAISSGQSRYAMKEGDPQIYVVNSTYSGWATYDVSKFQKPADAGAPKTAGGAPPGLAPGMQMPGMPPGHTMPPR